MRKNSIKNTRINTEVLRELSKIIHDGVKDPGVHPATSVISMEVTPDFRYYKAYISVLGNEDAAKATIEGLRSAEGYVRKELARRIGLRSAPGLKFILDWSIEYGVNTSKLTNGVTKDLRQGGGQDRRDEEEEI